MKPADKILWSLFVALVLLRVTGGGAPLAPAVRGPVRVVVLHETLDQTPDEARLINTLQTGETAKYLASQGHTLSVLDDDHPDVKAEWATGVQLPAVAVLDGKTQQVLYREPLPATAEALLAWLKGKGA